MAFVPNTKLRPEQEAPNVKLVSIANDTLNVQKLEGKILITFFRYAACPICNYRVHELTTAFDSLSREGYTLIGVFESKPELLKTYSQEYQIPFHVVADPDGDLYKSFRVEKSFWKTISYSSKRRIRHFHRKGDEYYRGSDYKRDASLYRSTADFVVENGIITNLSYNAIIGDHIPLKDL